MNPIKYLLEVRSELQKVTWPKITNVLTLTTLVILISVIVGSYLTALDAGATKLLGFILSK